MADEPWKNRTLTPGQVEQHLRRLGCTKAGKRGHRVEYWKPPVGPVFSVRIFQTTTSDIEGIAEQIEKWVAENQRRN